MDVSVIIVNYNTCRLTCDCIEAVVNKTTGIQYEIIVVDNASSDGSVDTITKAYPFVRLLVNKENIGFGRANNAGAAMATGKYFFLLNSDTVLLNNAIKILFDAMQQETDTVAAACSNFYNGDHQPGTSYFQYYPNLYNLLLYKTHIWQFMGHDIFNKTGAVKKVEMIIGAHLFIRAKNFTALQGFDPQFFMYLEDTDICLRLKKSGYGLISVPQAEIIHYQGKSSLIGSKLIMEASSFIHYFKKHHSRFTVGVYKITELFFAVIKMCLFFFSPSKRSAYASLAGFLLSGKKENRH